MKKLPFKVSMLGSIGTELEFQIVNPKSYALVSRAKELIRKIKESPFNKLIKPEITQSMIEINTSIHNNSKELYEELTKLQKFLLIQGADLQVLFCGGGTHPFQRWSVQKIFPNSRYKILARKYRYLSKQSTVFGQHIHIGCQNGEDALYLTHALIRYVPQFIALCASSPFYEGIDTGYDSARSTLFGSFPLSGVIPYLTTWEEFSNYYYKMRTLGIINSMKDFYWDIRPKPEFGTVEIRVCDSPLSMPTATMITAYIQALALYLLEEKPIEISHGLYYLYTYNRFQAARYGFEGDLIDYHTSKHIPIIEDILETIKKIERFANHLNSMPYISQILDSAINKKNDAVLMRNVFKQTNSLSKVVEEQCKLWKEMKQ